MNVYRIDYTTAAGTATYEHHNGVDAEAAIRSLIAHKANSRVFAVDLDKPVVATFAHPLIPTYHDITHNPVGRDLS